MDEDRLLTLQSGNWYGWTMTPGYGDEPYHSPIRIDKSTALRTERGLIDLSFLNLGYAAGVRNFQIQMRVIARTNSFLVLREDDLDRTMLVEPLTRGWLVYRLERSLSDVEHLVDETGRADDAALIRFGG